MRNELMNILCKYKNKIKVRYLFICVFRKYMGLWSASKKSSVGHSSIFYISFFSVLLRSPRPILLNASGRYQQGDPTSWISRKTSFTRTCFCNIILNTWLSSAKWKLNWGDTGFIVGPRNWVMLVLFLNSLRLWNISSRHVNAARS